MLPYFRFLYVFAIVEYLLLGRNFSFTEWSNVSREPKGMNLHIFQEILSLYRVLHQVLF